ncbi:MAG: ABC transporter ATP-binding protein/permease [Coriobacteriales bacterium]|jgi:ATP-binding cassette subfamily B protein|nr:ABC transporter ATP-binding protein/permease [Coriobacteriales bacterium]
MAENVEQTMTSGSTAKDRTGSDGLLALLRYAGRRRWLVVLGCLLSAASAVLALLPFLCIWQIARNLLAALPDFSKTSDLTMFGWVAAAAAVASVLTYMAGLSCTHRAAFHVAAQIRGTCCKHLLRIPLGYYQSVASGELRRHVDAGADLTEDVIAHKLPDVVAAIITPVAFIALSFVFDGRMGLACLLPIILGFALLGMTMGKGATSAMDDYQDAIDAMNREAVEYVRGMPVVKVFQQTAYSFKGFYQSIVAYGNLAFGFAQTSERPQVGFTVVTASAFILLVPVAAFAAASTTGGDWPRFAADVLFYAALCGIIPSMLTRVMYIGQSVMSARSALRNINAVLSVEPLAQPEVAEDMRDASIAFEDVCFAYPGSERDAISQVSFVLAPGQTLALVGPSGGGKSTCATLIPRFWDVRAGAVKVGGHDVRKLDARDLMENVAFVFQGGRLFADTLLENVRAARPDASREQVLAALADAQCDDIVAKLPQGVDTLIGAEGVYLSGGEQQRLLLARAILKDSAIVVLDEATAFADADNEARIQQSLKRVMKGRTVVIIAHRLSSVVDADQLLVIADGKVVERGTHASLVDANGPYRQMWEDYCASVSWEVAGAGRGSSSYPDVGAPGAAGADISVGNLAGLAVVEEVGHDRR